MFIYLTGLMLIAYRLLTSYAKWAFPVNVLADNKDTALKHRLALGAIFTWLFYQVASTLYGFIVG